MRWAVLGAALPVLLIWPLLAPAASTDRAPGAVTGVRWYAQGDVTVVRIDIEGRPGLRHARLRQPDRVLVELTGAASRLATQRELVVDRLLADVHTVAEHERGQGAVRIVLDLWRPIPYEVNEVTGGIEVVLGRGAAATVAAADGAPSGAAALHAQAPVAQALPPPTSSFAPAFPDEFVVDERVTVQSNNVKGNQALSFLTEGVNVYQELDLSFRKSLGPDATMEGALSTLYSDDKAVAPDNFGLRRLYLRVFGRDYEATAGDLLTTLTPLTLALPVKGVSVWKDVDVASGLRVTVVGGAVKTRWEEFWSDGPNETFTRHVAGIRIEQRLLPELAIGLNYLWDRDDPGSIPLTTTTVPDPTDLTGVRTVVQQSFPAGPPISNHVASVDARLILGGIVQLDAEVARSWTDPDTSQGGRRLSDNAYLVQVAVREGGFRSSARYFRVEPGFFSGAAFVLADQEELSLRADYDLPRWVTVGGTFAATRDNLEDTRFTTTRIQSPEARVSLYDLPYLAGLILDFRYRLRSTRTEDRSFDDETQTLGVDAAYRLGPVSATASYEHQDKRDVVDRRRESRVDIVGASVQAQFQLARLLLVPFVRYQYFVEDRFREGTEETTQSYQVALVVDWPEWAALTLSYDQSDTDSFFPSEGLVRRGGRAELRVRILGSDDRTFTLIYEQRDNDYADSSRNYTEEIMAARLAFRF